MIEDNNKINNKKEISNKKDRINNIVKMISRVLVIFWMIVVFGFSSEVADESSATSGNTIRKVILLFNSNLPNNELEYYVEMLQPIARKIAHFTLYALGGIILYNYTRLNKNNIKKINIRNAFIVGAVYSITDEIHQLFVPGRSGQVLDVIIDSAGVITGIGIIYLVINIVNNMAYKQKIITIISNNIRKK